MTVLGDDVRGEIGAYPISARVTGFAGLIDQPVTLQARPVQVPGTCRSLALFADATKWLPQMDGRGHLRPCGDGDGAHANDDFPHSDVELREHVE